MISVFVDPAQVGRGDSQVGMAELSLDHNKWHALAGHLDSVRVPKLRTMPNSA
jgi:hypothetical protein